MKGDIESEVEFHESAINFRRRSKEIGTNEALRLFWIESLQSSQSYEIKDTSFEGWKIYKTATRNLTPPCILIESPEHQRTFLFKNDRKSGIMYEFFDSLLEKNLCKQIKPCVAQSGRAYALGAQGREFKSLHADHFNVV